MSRGLSCAPASRARRSAVSGAEDRIGLVYLSLSLSLSLSLALSLSLSLCARGCDPRCGRAAGGCEFLYREKFHGG
ncbi:MAG: hypothetical protein F4X85_08730, partial [Acidimicrobiaceae bacterium]|nr:hypothetical protein [Acidimicrobiaceae bacterium]